MKPDHRAARLDEHRRHHRVHREAHREGPRLRRRHARRQGRLLRGPQLPRVRQALAPQHRRAARGRERAPRRGRQRREARPARLRALEGGGHGAVRLREPVGQGPPRLAHRVLGDGAAVTSASTSTSTPAAWTSSSRTTRTRSRRASRSRGRRFSRYWMHGGFLEIDNEKMSKSLGNFVTIQDLLERNDPEALPLLRPRHALPRSALVRRREEGRRPRRLPGRRRGRASDRLLVHYT